jgi:hypothetical protein
MKGIDRPELSPDSIVERILARKIEIEKLLREREKKI